MVSISDSTLRSNVWETLYDTLNDANLLSGEATVTAAYISSEEAPFPQVVINPVNVDKEDFSFDRSVSKKEIVVIVDLWTKKNKHKDMLTDEIDDLLSPLKMGGVMLNGWSESNALETPNSNKIHLKSITLSYLRVS